MNRSDLKPVKGGPQYCRRCKKGPRLLYRVTGNHGVLIGKWCFNCVQELAGKGVSA